MNALGRHILVELSSCNPEKLNDVAFIEKSMIDAAQIAGATVINSTFHHFSPWGVSGVVVIQESHLAIHTWPEYRYAAVDLFTCGETVNPWISFNHLKAAFEATFSVVELNRGSLEVIKKTDFKLKDKRSQGSESSLLTLSGGARAEGAATSLGARIERNVWFTDKDESQALSLRYTGDVLFDQTTEYQRVRVLESYAYGKMLTINNMLMCTERDEAHYHEMIVHPAMQAHLQAYGTAKKVLVIGGGDGGTVREILKYPDVESIKMVEIDEAVTRASRDWLPQLSNGLNNKKVDLIFGDGIRLVRESAKEAYDLIIVDGSDPVGPAEGLFSEEFYRNCYRLLKPKGTLVAQGESPMFHQKAFVGLHQCLARVFGFPNAHVMLFFAPTYPSGMWSMQIAMKGGGHPLKGFDFDRAESFSERNSLKYYNGELHRGSFALPNFVKTMLQS